MEGEEEGQVRGERWGSYVHHIIDLLIETYMTDCTSPAAHVDQSHTV